MSDVEMNYPPTVDEYIDKEMGEVSRTFSNISKGRLKRMGQTIRSLYRKARINAPKVIDIDWLKRQRSHRKKKNTTKEKIPKYVYDCIDSHWKRDKNWNELNDDVKELLVEEINRLYEENHDKPNKEVTYRWIRDRRKNQKSVERQKQKHQSDPIYREQRKENKRESENRIIQREFDGDCKAYRSSENKKKRERYEDRPDLRERHSKRKIEKYASDPDFRERTLARNRANNAKRKIEIETIFAKDTSTRTVEDVAELDKAAYDRMKDLRRQARRRMAGKNAKYFHEGIFVKKFNKIIYSTYSTLYMSGFDEPDEFSDFICEDMEKFVWTIEKHGTALQALFHQDKDTTQTFEIDEIFACHMFDNTPEHQVALWHKSNTQVLTKDKNNRKSKKAKRTKAFYQHVDDVNNLYRDNEELAFKVVVSNIASLDKVANVLKSKDAVTSWIPESCNESAWIDWYDKLDPGKNNYRKKVKELDEDSNGSWLDSFIRQVNDY